MQAPRHLTEAPSQAWRDVRKTTKCFSESLWVGRFCLAPLLLGPLVHALWQEKFLSPLPYYVLIDGKLLASVGLHPQSLLQVNVAT